MRATSRRPGGRRGHNGGGTLECTVSQPLCTRCDACVAGFSATAAQSGERASGCSSTVTSRVIIPTARSYAPDHTWPERMPITADGAHWRACTETVRSAPRLNCAELCYVRRSSEHDEIGTPRFDAWPHTPFGWFALLFSRRCPHCSLCLSISQSAHRCARSPCPSPALLSSCTVLPALCCIDSHRVPHSNRPPHSPAQRATTCGVRRCSCRAHSRHCTPLDAMRQCARWVA